MGRGGCTRRESDRGECRDDKWAGAHEIRLSPSSPEDRVEAMLAAWRARCPIYLALIKPQTVTLTIASGAPAS